MESSPKNCIRSSEKYWLNSPIDLLTNFSIWPTEHMGWGAKLNSVMRLAVIIFLVLMFVGYHFAVLFLVLAVIMNLIFYYAFRKEYD